MRKLILIFSLFYFTGVCVPNAQAQFFFMENQLQDKPAPNFNLERLNKGKQTLKKFRDGKKAIIFFWATWCPHCRTQLNVMNKEIDKFERKGIKVAAVDLGEKESIVRNFVRKNGIKLDIFLDEDSTTEEPYALIGLPTMVFIGEDGLVKAVKHSLPNDLDSIFESESVSTQ